MALTLEWSSGSQERRAHAVATLHAMLFACAPLCLKSDTAFVTLTLQESRQWKLALANA